MNKPESTSLGANLRALHEAFQNKGQSQTSPLSYGALPLVSEDESMHLLSRIGTHNFYMENAEETIRAFRSFAEDCLKMLNSDWDSYQDHEFLTSADYRSEPPTTHMRWHNTIDMVTDFFDRAGHPDFLLEHSNEVSLYANQISISMQDGFPGTSYTLLRQHISCLLSALGPMTKQEEEALYRPQDLKLSELTNHQQDLLFYIFNGAHFFFDLSSTYQTEMIFYSSNPFLEFYLESEIEGHMMDLINKDVAYTQVVIPFFENALKDLDDLSGLVHFEVAAGSYNAHLREALLHMQPAFHMPLARKTAVLFSTHIPLDSLERYHYLPVTNLI